MPVLKIDQISLMSFVFLKRNIYAMSTAMFVTLSICSLVWFKSAKKSFKKCSPIWYDFSLSLDLLKVDEI